MHSVKGELVAETPDPDSIELLGWLELALDDTKALVIVGMHDGVVPESINSDAFLPNTLRRQLGLADNDRRYARDMYALQLIMASREEVRFVVGKVDGDGDPLTPSRLLMACSLEALPSRVLHLVENDLNDTLPSVKSKWERQSKQTSLALPLPTEQGHKFHDVFGQVKAPKHITVTAFRDYLACPYRFYLRHVRKLRSIEDELSEMGARQFGNLVHDTLAELIGPIARSTDPIEINKFLLEHLHRLARERYGERPAAAVLIQIEQAELRLAVFAERQAEHAAEGWEVKFVEQGVEREDALLIGRDKQLPLVGRIDRIDYNARTKQWAIWDYKTSESAKNPLSVHWSKRSGWLDLQLPLYRHIAARLGVAGEPTLGYIAIPKQATDIGFHPAEFSDEQIDSADEKANDVAHRVANCEYWPDEIGEVTFDDYARICQVNTQRVSVAPPQRTVVRTLESDLGNASKSVADAAQQLLAKPKVITTDLPPLLIRASAGTGKTFQLSNRLLQILLSGQEVDGILATTFTRKAAGEILSRVLSRLAHACLNEEALIELQQHIQGVDSSAANCLASLKRLTNSIHRLRISTLDSFFAQIARTFSFELALPQGWAAMDPLQEPAFQMQSIGQMLDNHERKTLVDLVRMLAKGESSRRVADEIRRTVTAGYEAYRITEEQHWDQLECPKAPSEQAIESALLTLENSSLNHKKADQQLKRLHLLASIGDWEGVVTHGIYDRIDAPEPSYWGRDLLPSLVDALKLLVERAAATLLPVRSNQTKASYKVLDAYNDEYSGLLKRTRLLSFADVTHSLAQWLKKNDSSGEIRASSMQKLAFRLDCGVDHLLLDEFQDTSPQQWRILRPLAQPLAKNSTSKSEGLDDYRDIWIEATKKPPSQQSIFCVGDTKQAIYGWRGGAAEVFDSVTASIPHIEQQKLTRSFRSSPEVMTVVNNVFHNLAQHKRFADCEEVARDWSEQFPKHETQRKSLSGYVRLDNGPKVDSDLLPSEKKRLFLEHSARNIQHLTQKTEASIGVLLRTNQDVANMIAMLRDLGVPASQDGGNPLTDSAAVELVLSLMHLADHPGDRICLFHVATSPLAANLPFVAEAIEAKDANELALWLRQKVSRSGLGPTLEALTDHLASYLSWWELHRLEQLIQLGHEWDSNSSGRLRDFEMIVESKRVALPSESQVKVMTIHKSKGLEFDAVFLPELGIEVNNADTLLVLRGEDPCEPPTGVLRYMNSSLQAMLPESWREAFKQHKSRSIRESLCLLYVAMTRARKALYMVAHPHSKPTQEFDSILQSTLGTSDQAKKSDTIIYERGDATWFESSTDRPANADAEPEVLEVALRTDKTSAPQRGLRVTAPSYLSHHSEPVPLSEAFSYSHSLGSTYGKLIHRFFEQVQWLDTYHLDRRKLGQLAQASISPEELQSISVERAIDDFEDMLQLGSVRAALGMGRFRRSTFGQVPDRIDVDSESALSLVLDDHLVVGKVDRLVLLFKGSKPYAAEIIDFKTDAFDPNMTLLWLDDRVEHHRRQLQAYARVIAKLYHLPLANIAAHLVMLATDDFVKVELNHAEKAPPTAPHFKTADRKRQKSSEDLEKLDLDF